MSLPRFTQSFEHWKQKHSEITRFMQYTTPTVGFSGNLECVRAVSVFEMRHVMKCLIYNWNLLLSAVRLQTGELEEK